MVSMYNKQFPLKTFFKRLPAAEHRSRVRWGALAVTNDFPFYLTTTHYATKTESKLQLRQRINAPSPNSRLPFSRNKV